MGEFKFWMFLAGLGIFLFGIYMLEDSIEKLSGKAFKRMIRRYTSNSFRAIGSGVFATAILQSSSAVSLMALAFVSAGVIGMSQAVGVIIGSSLGTTITSWLVASIGFKVNIEAIALPFVGVGGLGLIFFGKTTRYTQISRLLVGFGFLFMGLDYMKESVELISAGFDPATLKSFGLWAFILSGLVLTAIIQSSSATIAIVLSALYGGLISFEQGSAMVIGAHVGTTVTVLLGSIGGNIQKKRVAAAHLFFKLTTAIIAWILLPVLVYLSMTIFHFENEPVLALAMFHTLFNVVGILIFAPFILPYTQAIEKIVKVTPTNIERHVQKLDAEVPEGAVGSFGIELQRLHRLVIHYNTGVWSVDANLIVQLEPEDIEIVGETKPGSEAQYQLIKQLYENLLAYSVRLHRLSLQQEEADKLNHYLSSMRLAMNSVYSMQEAREYVGELESSSNPLIKTYFHRYRKNLLEFYSLIIKETHSELSVVEIGEEFQKIKQKIKDQDEEITHAGFQDIKDARIEQRHLLRLLSAQRSYYQSCRQAANAIREYLLSKTITEAH
ncbi:MAG: Na/Pi cotransporter family protein [Bacteroidetes bacterium]|nr:MAG: Na/Pi cotransporter family protein [Bacteroidota bacterium]